MKKPQIPQNLDSIFEALANQHRREVVYMLGLQPYTITQLAEQRDLSLPAIHKHIKILKDTGLVIERKIGRTHFLSLNRDALLGLQNWLIQYQAYWGNNQETLENYATFLQRKKARKEVKKK